MKIRYYFTLALAAVTAYVLGAGCTQDFGAFQPCKADQKLCGSACVAMTDPDYGCTADGCAPCDVPNANGACASSECIVDTCQGRFQDCDQDSTNGCEVDIDSDPKNCNFCGNACVVPNAQAACDAGDCAVGQCDPGFDDCNGDGLDGCEVNLQSDDDHCGGCDEACPPFHQCSGGTCILECDPGTGDCDMDPTNGCETTLGSTTHCGACGDACDLANASADCNAGVCEIAQCNNDFEDCDGMDANGCEVNLDTNAAHCGECGRACGNQNVATATCQNGTCNSTCNQGYGNCSRPAAPAADDGCETDTNASVQHCGGCNQNCDPNNATGNCSGGTCMIATCDGTFEDCDNNVNNGCEVNTNTSANNCGMCGNVCNLPNATEGCSGGTCTIASCNGDFENCDNNPANGCEVNTDTSTAHCGACGRACNNSNTANLACANGLCTSTCNSGFGNCSQPAAPAADNGCESNLNTDEDHCGACARSCSNANVATRVCTGGLCNSTCDLGFANCLMSMAPMMDQGCETNASANNANCGGCGNNCGLQGAGFTCTLNVPGIQNLCGCSNNPSCNAGGAGTCSSGICTCNGVTCQPGEACDVGPVCSCNGGAACTMGQVCCQTPAGCRSLATDAQNCGACGHACSAGESCVAGVCQ
jgi:hypothetical protein